jgi:hypothetical protein
LAIRQRLVTKCERGGSPRKAATIFSAHVVREYEWKFSLKKLNTPAVGCLGRKFFRNYPLTAKAVLAYL